MPRAHSCRDLPDELQAWAKTVANLVTDMLWPASETGGPAGPAGPGVPLAGPDGILVGPDGILVGSGTGSGDEDAAAGAVGGANDEPAVTEDTEGTWVPWVPWVVEAVTVAGSTTRPNA